MAAPRAMFDQILGFARDNDADCVREIVRLGCPPSFGNKVGQTALHIAGIWGSVEALKTLLECRADPNAQNKLRGSAPLHAAAMGKGPAEKRAECVRLLLSFKADAKMPDFGGELPIDAADDEVIRLALGAAPLIVHKAIQAKSSSALQEALTQVKKRQVNLTIEAPNPKGETPLHLAVILGWREGIQSLLQARATVITQSNSRQSPLHASVHDPRVTRLLVAANADANAQDADQDHDPRFASTTFKQDPYAHRSPLHYAAELHNTCVARLLLEGRANPNLPDSKQETPLHLCVASLRNDEPRLEAGCGVRINGLQNKPAWNGRIGALLGPAAPASGASSGPPRWPVFIDDEAGASDGVLLKEDNLKRLREEMIDLLLEARADVNLGNQVLGESRTVLHEAAHAGDVALVERVLSARADVTRQDAKMSLSALHLAARSKHHAVVCLLVEARADLSQVTSSGKTAAELAETNGASAATLAVLRGSQLEVHAGTGDAELENGPQTLDSLTAEQRAMLFLD